MNRLLLCCCPSPPSTPSPASRWAGAARRVSPLPKSNLIHAQPRASGRLSCGCSSPALSCHNIDTKQNNSDGETLPGSGRQTGEETGSNRLRYCAGRGSSLGCFQALLPAITPADKRGRCRRSRDAGSVARSPHQGANVCIVRASSRRLSQNVGGGVAHLSLSLKPGSR